MHSNSNSTHAHHTYPHAMYERNQWRQHKHFERRGKRSLNSPRCCAKVASCDSPFTALELRLVRPAGESDSKVTECGSHVKRVVTRGSLSSHNRAPAHWTQSSHTCSCTHVMNNCAFLWGKQHVQLR